MRPLERADLDRAIFGGERSAAQIAEDFGISSRTVVRRRAALRVKGMEVRVPEDGAEFRVYARRAR